MTCTHQHAPRSPLACGMICLSSRESPPHPSVFPRPWDNSESQTNDTMPPESLATICVPPKSGSTAYFAIFGGNAVETIGFKVSGPYPNPRMNPNPDHKPKSPKPPTSRDATAITSHSHSALKRPGRGPQYVQRWDSVVAPEWANQAIQDVFYSPKVRHIAVLRHPVERIISSYRAFCAAKPGSKKAMRTMSLEEYGGLWFNTTMHYRTTPRHTTLPPPLTQLTDRPS